MKCLDITLKVSSSLDTSGFFYHATLNCSVRGRKCEDHSPELCFLATSETDCVHRRLSRV